MRPINVQDLSLGKRLYLSVDVVQFEVFGDHPEDPRASITVVVANDAVRSYNNGEIRVSDQFLLTEDI